MTVKKFDVVPTPSEALNLEGISDECIKLAWESYESKPEYKSFNKHDLIESIQIDKKMTSIDKKSN